MSLIFKQFIQTKKKPKQTAAVHPFLSTPAFAISNLFSVSVSLTSFFESIYEGDHMVFVFL